MYISSYILIGFIFKDLLMRMFARFGQFPCSHRNKWCRPLATFNQWRQKMLQVKRLTMAASRAKPCTMKNSNREKWRAIIVILTLVYCWARCFRWVALIKQFRPVKALWRKFVRWIEGDFTYSSVDCLCALYNPLVVRLQTKTRFSHDLLSGGRTQSD